MRLPFRLSLRALGDGFWSLAGTVVSVLAGLAIVKIVAAWVPREQYGAASLALGVAVLLNNLLVGPLMAAHMRVYFDYRERGLGGWYVRLFTQACFVAAVASSLMYLIIAIGFWAVGSPSMMELALPAMLLIGLQPFLSATVNYLEAHKFYKRLGMVNTGQRLLQVPALLLLLSAPVSSASAVIFSQAAAIVPFLFVIRGLSSESPAQGTPPPKQGREAWVELFREFAEFGVSLPLGYLINWILSTSDRYLVAHFMTTQDVGVYAMNYGFWSMPFLMLGAWLEILTRPRIYERAAKEDWRGMRNILVGRAGVTLGLGLLGLGALALIGRPLASLMLGTAYRVGWIVPASIAVAHLFLVLGYSVSPLFLATKKTEVILYATAAAALLNVGLNLWAIPALGLVGAAMSTAAAYLLWAAMLFVFAIRYGRRLIRSLPPSDLAPR